MADATALRASSVHVTGTVLLAVLAYGYLLGFPALALIFLGRAMFFATRLEWLALTQSALASAVFALVAYLLHRIRPTPPTLLELPETSAPKLFQMIEHVRQQCRAPRLGRVFIDDGMDVRMIYTPRSGFPFSYSYSLVVGLPAMQLLSPLHFKGLVARRLGQASRRNNRLTGWLSALRYLGPGLLSACPNWRSVENIVVRAFFIWYTPLYKRVSVQVARVDELLGDLYMMDLVNDRDVAELMSAQIIAERYLKEHYGPAILEQARKRPNPLPIIYSGIDRKFNRYWSSTDAKRWLQTAFASESAANDPSPSLRRRLIEIGHRSPRLPSPLRQAASRVLLEGALKPVMAKLDRAWARRVANDWRDLHRRARQENRRLGLLYKKSRTQRLTHNEARELALLVERCHGKTKAKPFFAQLLKLHGDDAAANFAAGRFLLSIDEERGLEVLDKAMSLDQRLAARATRLIEGYKTEQRRAASDSGEFPTISDTELPIIVTETPEVVTETAIRQAVSQIGEHGAITDLSLQTAISGPHQVAEASASAGVNGLGGAISESGVRGAAAIESGLRDAVSKTGQPVLAMEKATPRAGTGTGLQKAVNLSAAGGGKITDLGATLANKALRHPLAGGAGLQKAVHDTGTHNNVSDDNNDRSDTNVEGVQAYAVLRASVTGERIQTTAYTTGERIAISDTAPDRGVTEMDLDKALAATASHNSVTAARLQSAVTDSAVRKAISNTQLRKAN
ncbi:MAG: hypothetical protein OET44_10785 [Gammaproteobacteria bacterium]|nr:hypothetical protein [Gammaproteobacteria bacterium]